MKDLKSGIEHLEQAKAHMIEANGIMSDHISKLKALEEENAELRNELDDWKGNAEGFQPDAYMRLPLDADGVPIRIGDKVKVDGEDMTVLGYRLYSGTLFLIVKEIGSNNTYSPKPSSVRHFKYVPPDSWEKLEEDAKKTPCGYALAPRDEDGLRTCDGCRFEKCGPCHIEMVIDMLERAKKLAGIEELEGGER